MAKVKKDLTKEERINKEIRRLKKKYEEVDPMRRAVAEGLIAHTAFLGVEMEELEKDIAVNGFDEKFSQGNQEPYDRTRPKGQAYLSAYSNYTKAIAQLDRMLGKNDAPKETADPMGDFIRERRN